MAEINSVDEVAELACLQIEESDRTSFQNHFEKVLQQFSSLQSVDTSGVEPMVTPHQIFNSLRRDEVVSELSIDEILENAPEVKDNLFKVPPVV